MRCCLFQDFALSDSDACACTHRVNNGYIIFILQDASRLYVVNMNHFGRAGGYAALLSRIDPNRAAGPVSLEEYITYVGFLAAVPKCFVLFSKEHL